MKIFLRPMLHNILRNMGMEKVSRGLYIMDDVWPDELFILQQRNGAIIYSERNSTIFARFDR